jgi:hypothetical protein
MRVTLMNAANMPQDGVYSRQSITRREFVKRIKRATVINSSIGYESVAQLISEMTGREIQKNRNVTQIEDGEIILVMKLRYRIDPKDKGTRDFGIDEYEYLLIRYINDEKKETTKQE